MPLTFDVDEHRRRLLEMRKNLWLEASAVAQQTWLSKSLTQDEVRRFYELMAMIEEIDQRIGRLLVTEDPVPLRVVMHGE